MSLNHLRAKYSEIRTYAVLKVRCMVHHDGIAASASRIVITQASGQEATDSWCRMQHGVWSHRPISRLLHSWAQRKYLSHYAPETYPYSVSTCVDYAECSGRSSRAAGGRGARRDATTHTATCRHRRYSRTESAFVPALPGMVPEDREARVETR